MSTLVNRTLLNQLLKRNLVFPRLNKTAEDNLSVAKRLDVALMESGFKLSHDLMLYIGSLPFEESIDVSKVILINVAELVGNNVKHNVYFKNFPQHVPDNDVFWFNTIVKWFFTGDGGYGSYHHTYEEMLAVNEKLELKNTNFRVISLGGAYNTECKKLFNLLVGSNIPLSGQDLALLEVLLKENFDSGTSDIPIRENKAIVSAYRINHGQPVQFDTVTDALRLATYLSAQSVDLSVPVKFKSFSKRVRRSIVAGLDKVIKDNIYKLDDVFKYEEQFKRLASSLHPFDFKKQYPQGCMVFGVASGSHDYYSWNQRVHKSITNGDMITLTDLLAKKPGYMARYADKIIRDSDEIEEKYFIEEFEKIQGSISTRVLLSLWQHFKNRNKTTYRVFVNKLGKGYALPNHDKKINISSIIGVIKKELSKRFTESLGYVSWDDDFASVAIPLTSKNTDEGFNVLPRGSEILLSKAKPVLRFFIYWKQKNYRTDYDLSCAFYDKDFNFLSHVSWTSISGQGAVYSGDITSASSGASEFIDIDFDKIPSNAHYLVPSVNHYAGENFNETEECFFGFMLRDLSEKGKPFEPATVKYKFNLNGANKIATPLVFVREGNKFKAKWMNLYSKGNINSNTVVGHKYSSGLLARSIAEREYVTIGDICDLIEDTKSPIHSHFCFNKPEDANSDVKYYTLSNLLEIV